MRRKSGCDPFPGLIDAGLGSDVLCAAEQCPESASVCTCGAKRVVWSHLKLTTYTHIQTQSDPDTSHDVSCHCARCLHNLYLLPCSICKQLIGKVKPGAMAISLIKGMRVRPEGPQLISQMVER